MIIEAAVSSGFQSSWITVGTSPVPLSTKLLVSKFGVQLKASASNTGKIYVGGPEVTADQTATGGHPLLAGEGLFLPVDHLESIYAVADGANQKLSVLVLK